MLEVLEKWKTKDWVQRFTFKTKGSSKRPTTMWRATVRLKEDWSKVKIVGNLPRSDTDIVNLD